MLVCHKILLKAGMLPRGTLNYTDDVYTGCLNKLGSF
jgi:hypothetical protein